MVPWSLILKHHPKRRKHSKRPNVDAYARCRWYTDTSRRRIGVRKSNFERGWEINGTPAKKVRSPRIALRAQVLVTGENPRGGQPFALAVVLSRAVAIDDLRERVLRQAPEVGLPDPLLCSSGPPEDLGLRIRSFSLCISCSKSGPCALPL